MPALIYAAAEKINYTPLNLWRRKSSLEVTGESPVSRILFAYKNKRQMRKQSSKSLSGRFLFPHSHGISKPQGGSNEFNTNK